MRHTLAALRALGAVALAAWLGAGCTGRAVPDPDEPPPPLAGQVRRATVGATDRLPGSTGALLVSAGREDVGDPPVAADVIEAFKRRGRRIGQVEAPSATEARFADTWLAGVGAAPELANGGVVEIKATPADARASRASFQLTADLLPWPSGYYLTHGRIVVRLSSRLDPEAVQRYEAILRRLRG